LAPYTPPPYPPPTNDEKIIVYFLEYIMSEKVHGNEDYTYGSFIKPQLQKAIDLLIATNGNTNQSCISVGDRQSIFLKDPPCLRTITFKVVEKKLNMTVLFRSWDLYAGLPENLGGLQMLKEYVLSQIEDYIDVIDGNLIAYSDGLHIYDQYFDLANALNVDKIKVDSNVLLDKERFAKELG
jgi:thymidylate synthase